MPTTARGAKSGLDGHSGQFVQANKPRFGTLQKNPLNLSENYDTFVPSFCKMEWSSPAHYVGYLAPGEPVMMGASPSRLHLVPSTQRNGLAYAIP